MLARFLAAWLLILSAWGCQSTPTPAPDAEATPAAETEEVPEEQRPVVAPSASISDALTAAEALAAQFGHAAAANALIDAAAQMRVPDSQRQLLHDALWAHLARVSAAEARVYAQTGSQESRGWWRLAHDLRSSTTLAAHNRLLRAWQQAQPEHPAAALPPSALAASLTAEGAVTRVGLLLPLSGNLARAGRTVRDGFIASYLSNRDDAGYSVTVYDTAAEPMASLYERALAAGEQVLIGPLAKEAAVELNRLNPEVPVLALNYLGDEIPAEGLLQLGLAIEDEAYTLAEWLDDAGMRRLLLFHNREDWSVRATRAIRESWPGQLEVQTLEDIRTVTESVGVAMRVAESHRRRDELQALLGEPLEFSPRARGDVDAIIALVTSLEATALVPALRFHFAEGVPVFATSQTVRGMTAERMATLNGFRVSELPWFVADDPVFADLDGAFSLDGNLFVALYALGADAFRLADRIPLLLDGSLAGLLGSTGELNVLPDGRIQRELARTIVRGGRVHSAQGLAAD